jgi:hypothetical protein
MSDCVICFEIIKGKEIKCKNKTCTSVLCFECMFEYIKICITNNKIPKCTNLSCGRYLLYSDIKHHSELIESYSKCCFNELLLSHGDNARKEVEIISNIEQLKNQRRKFVNDHFPPAIAFAATIIMPKKLKSIDKKVKERIRKLSSSSNRLCMNLLCGGSLNKDLTCLSCSTKFCIDCEKEIKDKHICDPNDVEAIKTIKQMIHCPSCNLPIEKSSGCDSMKCVHCGEKFSYSTGKTGGPGNNHNIDIEQIKKKVLLSVVYKDELSTLGLLDLVIEIEKYEPKITDDTILSRFLKEYYKNNSITTPELEKNLAICFEKYITRVYINKCFHQIINEIEKLILNKTLDFSYLLNKIKFLKYKS